MPVFISHSQQDVAPFSSLCLAFDGAHIAYWDPNKMEQGMSLSGQLRKAIQECELCVFLATKRSLDSKWCSAEVGAFWGAGKRVIVYLADADVSEALLPPQFQGDLWTRDARSVMDTVRAVLETEESKRAPTAAQFRAACCKIQMVNDKGPFQSGYLVDKNIVATAHYISQVSGTQSDIENIQVQFGREVIRRIVKADINEETGAALLTLDSPLQGIAPLPLVEQYRIGMVCQGWGFPHATRGAGVPFTGEIIDTEFIDVDGQLRIIVYSPALTNAPLRGMGGAALWADGAVIGHVSAVFSDAVFGLIIITPSTAVLRLLRSLHGQ